MLKVWFIKEVEFEGADSAEVEGGGADGGADSVEVEGGGAGGGADSVELLSCLTVAWDSAVSIEILSCCVLGGEY